NAPAERKLRQHPTSVVTLPRRAYSNRLIFAVGGLPRPGQHIPIGVNPSPVKRLQGRRLITISQTDSHQLPQRKDTTARPDSAKPTAINYPNAKTPKPDQPQPTHPSAAPQTNHPQPNQATSTAPSTGPTSHAAGATPHKSHSTPSGPSNQSDTCPPTPPPTQD